jgi:hypothetical protein
MLFCNALPATLDSCLLPQRSILHQPVHQSHEELFTATALAVCLIAMLLHPLKAGSPLRTAPEKVDCLSGGCALAVYLARMAENAACPGVSRKVMVPPEPGILTWKAPMCWVMPPASPAATLVLRRASSRVVLPWSTCPIMVTTGGLSTASLSRFCHKKSTV